jgi:hypothetical protein
MAMAGRYGAFDAAWAALPAAARQVLAAAEADDVFAVAHLARSCEAAADVWQELGGLDEHLPQFLDLRGLALQATKRKAARDLRITDEEHQIRVDKRIKELKDIEREHYFNNRGLAASSVMLPPRPTPLARSRSSLRPGGRAAGDNRMAADKEQVYRKKYIDEIIDLLVKVRSPTSVSAALCGDLRGTLSLVAAGRRASTLRTRLRAWRGFLRWLLAAHAEEWPSSWLRLLEYARMRAAEPCGKQTLLGFMYSATFWERASGTALTIDPLWKPAFQELLAGLGGRAGGGASISAVPMLSRHLAALEVIATDAEEPRWLRGYATWKLLQAWGTLRFDDHRGIDHSRVEMMSGVDGHDVEGFESWKLETSPVE